MTAHEILRQIFGYEAFRPGQEALVSALLQGKDALGVMPTGSGKSICYQVPALMLPGSALVISPLISLMKDQVTALKTSGVPAAYINSSLTLGQQTEALRRAALGAYKIIYVAPERLELPAFRAFARACPISLVAVDEAHCVSQWGQDFRKSYLHIAEFLSELPTRPPVGAFTATATVRVREDIVRLLPLRQPEIQTTGFDRPNLRFSVLKPVDRMGTLIRLLSARPRESGIVYCMTRKTVEQVCAKLVKLGMPATRYHAGLSDIERAGNQEAFQYDRARVMVATNAFGMGIDKSNVSYVIHFNMPKDIESYYQEAGRAGRDGEPADCVLLYGGQDVYTAKWLIEHGEDNDELTPEEQKLLKARELDRLRQMTFYSTTRSCLRAFILRYFNQGAPERCDNCSVCAPGALEAAAGAQTAKNETVPRERAARNAAPKQKPDAAVPSQDQTLFDALRALRASIAKERGVPAYVVFPDSTLRALAHIRPTTTQAMSTVSGVGSYKLAAFGEAFIRVIAEHVGSDQDDMYW